MSSFKSQIIEFENSFKNFREKIKNVIIAPEDDAIYYIDDEYNSYILDDCDFIKTYSLNFGKLFHDVYSGEKNTLWLKLGKKIDEYEFGGDIKFIRSGVNYLGNKHCDDENILELLSCF